MHNKHGGKKKKKIVINKADLKKNPALHYMFGLWSGLPKQVSLCSGTQSGDSESDLNPKFDP